MKRFLSLLTVIAFVGITNVWGLDVTSTFTNESWGVGSGEPTWTASSISVQAKVDKGVQVTLSNIKNASGFTLTNNTFKNTSGLDKITGITLNVSANGTGGSIAGVTVGGTAFKNGNSTSYNVSKSDGQTPSFTHATGVKGDIIISFSSTATSKSLYIKSITITYTTTSQSCTNEVTVTKVVSGNGSFYRYRLESFIISLCQCSLLACYSAARGTMLISEAPRTNRVSYRTLYILCIYLVILIFLILRSPQRQRNKSYYPVRSEPQ